MPSVLIGVTNYPTIQTITNLVRSDVRDDMAGSTNTLGEGQILVDNTGISVTMANLFNSAARELSRELRLQQATMLIRDNYIIYNIPPLNGPQGLAVADPAVQVAIGVNGYYDGTEWHSSYCFPTGVFQVIRCWERQNSSNDTFADMGEPSDGLAGVYQSEGWGRWEWRNDMVWTPGSLDNRDLRIRYLASLETLFLPNVDVTTTYVPIIGCEEAIARKIDRLYSVRQGAAIYDIRKAEEEKATKMFLNEQIKRQQGTNYQTLAYGSENPPVLSYGQ